MNFAIPRLPTPLVVELPDDTAPDGQMRAALEIAVNTGADLAGAYLAGAKLARADLTCADLAGADLTGADLTDAYLYSVNLAGAKLARANLTGAYLAGAKLARADLTCADLDAIKHDLCAVLLRAEPEVPALLTALVEGRINGSVYHDDCGMGCLVGTLAIARGCNVHKIDGIAPDPTRPIERWFLAIQPGDTPEKSQIARITVGWVREFAGLVGIALPPGAQS